MILIPSSFLCLKCPMYCQSCDSNAKCTLCSVNYTLNQESNSCVLMSNNTIMDNNTNNNSTVPNNNNQQNNNTNNLTIKPKYAF